MSRSALITDLTHFIGQPSAQALLALNYQVFGTDDTFSNEEHRLAAEAASPGLIALAPSSPEELIAAVVAKAGTLDVLINNDAYPAEKFAIEDVPDENMKAAFEALVYRPMRLCRAAVPQFKKQGEGKIIFITSAAPLNGMPNFSIYLAARGAGNSLALALSKELARSNIQVNAVAPNFVDNPDYYPKSLMADPERAAKILKQIPMGRLGSPEEAASIITYLADPLSHFITGQVIPLSGGWATAR